MVVICPHLQLLLEDRHSLVCHLILMLASWKVPEVCAAQVGMFMNR